MTLNRPPCQVIKGIHVKDEDGIFCDILDDVNGVKYDHLISPLSSILNDCEVVKGEVFSRECIHVYLDFTVQRVSRITATEVRLPDGHIYCTQYVTARNSK